MSEGTPVRLAVPFINEEMVERFFLRNPHLQGADITPLDNRERGVGLPVLYNEFIAANLERDAWLFFLHEDFEFLGPLPELSGLRTEAVYGTFGARLEGRKPCMYGRHTCSNKDGSNARKTGIEIAAPTWVDTLDCQSILLHSAMLRAHPGLRFDEGLSFDLYAEEFCLNAQENHGLSVMVLPARFQHYSYGRIIERYREGLAHLAERYPDSAVPGTCTFIGGRAAELEAGFTYDNKALQAEAARR
ncbi:hypothetical protein SAMN04488026_10479 [Aliiruegeria lutimaris]|uniref:Glycosyltransferase like family protein n=2 Tax=Aliiruegeria lutimaris TaxID=571298 RepID=A0A1G9DE63_9RHOB|nr:hypothetical protein SAMN04488026_10479 [Aliiruegeria lutimaris]